MICSQDGVDVWQLDGVGDTHLVGIKRAMQC